MAEIDEIMAIVKDGILPFPFKVGILSRPVKQITEDGENPLDYVTATTKPFVNAEELELWLDSNKDKKHILLMPVSAGRILAAKKMNKFLKKNKPYHYSQARKKKM